MFIIHEGTNDIGDRSEKPLKKFEDLVRRLKVQREKCDFWNLT